MGMVHPDMGMVHPDGTRSCCLRSLARRTRRAAPIAWVLLGLALGTDAWAGVGATNCYIMHRLRDNLTIKADVPNGRLRVDQENSFRVYLHNTMSHPFWNARLEVLSDQFEAAIVPSPRWKTYPDVQSAVTGGTREYFTVALRRKPGVPDGKYDVSLRVYTTRFEAPKLNAVLTLAEAVDQHEVPLRPGMKIDGQARLEDWGATPTLTDFASYSKINGDYFHGKPADQTRVHVAADRQNVYMLVMCMGAYDRTAKGNEFRIYVAPQIESKPVLLTLDESSGQITSSRPVAGLQCVKCPDDPEAGNTVAMYEIQIPRQPLGIDKDHFYLNFCRAVAGRLPGSPAKDNRLPEYSFWRGNEASVHDPVVYARMLIHAKQ